MNEDLIRFPKDFKNQQICIPDYGYIFANKIPLLMALSRKIDFTAKSCLHTQTDRDILKYSWRIYGFYFKCGFKITIVYANGEFAPVRELIAEMSSGPMANLTSTNVHVPEIDWMIWLIN